MKNIKLSLNTGLKRSVLSFFAASIMGVCSVACTPAAQDASSDQATQESKSTEKPNFIVILADDMGYSDLGVTGGELNTPNIDALANQGVLFSNFYNTGRCSTTRASLLTGRYSHSTGIGHLVEDTPYPGYRGFINENTATVAEVMSENGYRTILSGKWHVGSQREQWPDQRGFDRFYGIPAGGGLYFYPTTFLDRTIYKNGEKVVPTDPNYYSTNAFTDEAMGFIDEAKTDKTPFFLYLAYVAPHFPLQAPEDEVKKNLGKYNKNFQQVREQRFANQKASGLVPQEMELSPILTKKNGDKDEISDRKMAVYATQIEILDKNIGRLVTHLKEQNLFDNTVILFLSDNGAASINVKKQFEGEIGSADSFASYGIHWANVSNTPYRKYKKQVHEGGIITPLVMSWPNGLKQTNQVIRRPQHVIDIVPTILDIANVPHLSTLNNDQSSPAIEPVDGQSFTDVLSDNKAAQTRLLFWEHEGNAAVRDGDWKVVKANKKPWELYNLADDPTELKNLAKKNKEKVTELAAQYDSWAEKTNVRPWPLKKDKKKKK